MVAIKKGKLEKLVTYGAYENFYKNSGWNIIGSGKTIKENISEYDNTSEENEEVLEDEWDKALEDENVEKPLSDMNGSELRQKAKSLGIDITGLSTNKQIKEAIVSSGKY